MRMKTTDDAREGERRRPRVRVPPERRVTERIDQQEREEIEERAERFGRPFGREVRGGLQQRPRAEHDPARPHQPVADTDVEQGDEPDQDPVPVASWKSQSRPPPMVRPATTCSQNA